MRSVRSDAVALCLQTEKRLVSAAALREEVAEEARALEDLEKRTVSKRERKRIKERLLARDLAKAQKVKRRLQAVVDLRRNLLYVDTANAGQPEVLLKWLRLALQTFPAVPLRFNTDLARAMTEWLRAGRPDDLEGGHGLSLPAGLDLGDELALAENADPPVSVRLKNLPDTHPTLQAYLGDGFQAEALRLLWGDPQADGTTGHRMGFTLDAAARVKGITMTWHSAEHEAAEDEEATFDADALLAVAGIRDLLADMADWFGGMAKLEDEKP